MANDTKPKNPTEAPNSRAGAIDPSDGVANESKQSPRKKDSECQKDSSDDDDLEIDGPDRDDPSDKFTNYNSEQTLTRKESECKRKASDDSDLGPPSEGFATLFAPSDEAMEQGFQVAEAATDDFASGKLRKKPKNDGAGHTSKAHSSTAKVDISASAPKLPGPSAAGSTPASVPKNDAVVGERDKTNVKTSDNTVEKIPGYGIFRCTNTKCRTYGNDKYNIYLPEEDGTMNVLSCNYCREYSLIPLSDATVVQEANSSSIKEESTNEVSAEQESLKTETDKDIFARLSYVPGLKKYSLEDHDQMEKNYGLIQEYMSEFLAKEESLYEKYSSSEEEQIVAGMDDVKIDHITGYKEYWKRFKTYKARIVSHSGAQIHIQHNSETGRPSAIKLLKPLKNKSGRKRTKGKEPARKYKLWRQWRTQYHTITGDSSPGPCDHLSPLYEPHNQASYAEQPTADKSPSIHGTVLCNKQDTTCSIAKGASKNEDCGTLSAPQQLQSIEPRVVEGMWGVESGHKPSHFEEMNCSLPVIGHVTDSKAPVCLQIQEQTSSLCSNSMNLNPEQIISQSVQQKRAISNLSPEVKVGYISLRKRSRLDKSYCIKLETLDDSEKIKNAGVDNFSFLASQQTPTGENKVSKSCASRKRNASEESLSDSPYRDCETFLDEFTVSHTHRQTKLAYYYGDETYCQRPSIPITRIEVSKKQDSQSSWATLMGKPGLSQDVTKQMMPRKRYFSETSFSAKLNTNPHSLLDLYRTARQHSAKKILHYSKKHTQSKQSYKPGQILVPAVYTCAEAKMKGLTHSNLDCNDISTYLSFMYYTLRGQHTMPYIQAKIRRGLNSQTNYILTIVELNKLDNYETEPSNNAHTDDRIFSASNGSQSALKHRPSSVKLCCGQVMDISTTVPKPKLSMLDTDDATSEYIDNNDALSCPYSDIDSMCTIEKLINNGEFYSGHNVREIKSVTDMCRPYGSEHFGSEVESSSSLLFWSAGHQCPNENLSICSSK